MVPRGFGRDSVTGPALVLTVISRYPVRESGHAVFGRDDPNPAKRKPDPYLVR